MENLKQMQSEFVLYMLAKDFSSDAVPTPAVERILWTAAGVGLALIIIAFLF